MSHETYNKRTEIKLKWSKFKTIIEFLLFLSKLWISYKKTDKPDYKWLKVTTSDYEWL